MALDDDMAIWNSFSNNYWPEEYLTDRDGQLRQVYIGEGEYDQKENDVRTLLGVPVERAACRQCGTRRSADRSADAGDPFRPVVRRAAVLLFVRNSSREGTTMFTAPSLRPVDTFALEGVGT